MKKIVRIQLDKWNWDVRPYKQNQCSQMDANVMIDAKWAHHHVISNNLAYESKVKTSWQNRIVGCFETFPKGLLPCKKVIMGPLGPIHIYVFSFQPLFILIYLFLITLIFPYVVISSLKNLSFKDLKVFQDSSNMSRFKV